jgi:hypothetical protein
MEFESSLHRAMRSESLITTGEQLDDMLMREVVDEEAEAMPARTESEHPPSEQPELEQVGPEADDEAITRGSPAPSIAPSAATAVSASSRVSKPGKRRQRHGASSTFAKNPSLYDLVAGKVRLRTHWSSTDGVEITKPFSPAEYYFVRKRVKTGNPDEDDRLYWRPEVDKHKLPPSDLLWGIHQRASEFYTENGKGQFKFMDETALLAMGVLLEETMRGSLGETGHLAFLEPDEDATQYENDGEGNSNDNNVAGSDAMDSPRPLQERRAKRIIPKGYTEDDFLTDED